MRTAFISYRTGDIESTAGSIAAHLMDAMGADEIFYAPQSIRLATEFDVTILTEVRACPVLVVVIGPRWLDVEGRSGGRKIDEPADWVRREIAEGLRTGSSVIIILVDGARMPTEDELPEEIADLVRYQYRRMSYRSLPQDRDRLIADLLDLPEFAHVALTGGERLDDWWRTWERENPDLRVPVLLAGREEAAVDLRELLASDQAVVEVCGNSVEESTAFVAAALLPVGEHVRMVTDQAAWDRYAASRRNLVLVAASAELDTAAPGHRVVRFGGAQDQGWHLPPIGLTEAADAFEAQGVPREVASRHATRARQDFRSLRRDLSRAGRSRIAGPEPVEADRGALAAAVARGPLRHLGLEQVESRANELVATNPGEAAELYAAIVAVLLEKGFATLAVPLRQARGRALAGAGDRDGAVRIALDLFWEAALNGMDTIHAEVPWSAHGLAPELARAATAASSCAQLLHGHSWKIDEAVARFDALVDGDPCRLETAVFLAEHAAATRRNDVVEDRLDTLRALASAREAQDSPEERLVARLGMCLAEITGQWGALLRRARLEFAPWHEPWIRARRARWLVMTNELIQARDAYEEAIADALVAGMSDEAADWLYALRVVRGRLGTLYLDGDQQHPLAQHLRPMASSRRLPGRHAVEELALKGALASKGPSALRLVSQWRWKAYVQAGLANELEASAQLGSLLVANEEPLAGLHELVWAGMRSKAVEVAKSLPERTVNWSAGSVGNAAAQQSAALAAAAACADLLADEDVFGWIELALDTVRDPQPCTPADDLVRQALKLLGSLGRCLTEKQATTFLDVAGSWSLGSSATLLVDIAETYAHLRDRALGHLLDGVPRFEDYADVAMGWKGAALLRRNAALVGEKFADVEDNHAVYLALALTGQATEAARDHARQLAERIVARPEPVPGQVPMYVGYEDWPILVDLLEPHLLTEFASTLLRHASDARDSTRNRRTALEGLAVLAPRLAAEQQRALFDALRPFVRGECEGSAGDWYLKGARHPLSWLRINDGPVALADQATLVCARLAATEEERGFIRKNALRLLSGQLDVSVATVARSLESVVEEVRDLPLGHPDRHIQALTAVLWARRPEDVDFGLRLAASPHRFVRATLAAALKERSEHAAVREVLIQDPRRSIRTVFPHSSPGAAPAASPL